MTDNEEAGNEICWGHASTSLFWRVPSCEAAERLPMWKKNARGGDVRPDGRGIGSISLFWCRNLGRQERLKSQGLPVDTCIDGSRDMVSWGLKQHRYPTAIIELDLVQSPPLLPLFDTFGGNLASLEFIATVLISAPTILCSTKRSSSIEIQGTSPQY